MAGDVEDGPSVPSQGQVQPCGRTGHGLRYMSAFATRLEGTGVALAGELSAAPGAGGRPSQEWLELRPFFGAPPTVTE